MRHCSNIAHLGEGSTTGKCKRQQLAYNKQLTRNDGIFHSRCLAGLLCQCAKVARSWFLFMVATKNIELCDFWICGCCFGQAVIWRHHNAFWNIFFWSRYRIEWIKKCDLTFLIFSNRDLQNLRLTIMCVSFCAQCNMSNSLFSSELSYTGLMSLTTKCLNGITLFVRKCIIVLELRSATKSRLGFEPRND